MLQSMGLQRVRHNGMAELEDCLVIFLSVFLFCWKISMGCLALELAALG